MILRTILELLAGLLAIAFLRLCYRIYRQAFSPSELRAWEISSFLRPVNIEDVEDLIDPTAEKFLQLNLGEKQFRKLQRKRMLRLLEQAGRMAHNTVQLRDWIRHERIKSITNNDRDLEAAADKLADACIQVEGGARAIQFAIHLWLIRSTLLPFVKIMYLSSLAHFDSFDLLHAYEQMANAALELCQLADSTKRADLVKAL